MARFRDATGRTGPSTWELGSYPDGQADFPVAGISWFEASAYARFAGKSLPTLYHWFRASGTDEPYSDILHVEQFQREGSGQSRRARGARTVGHARHGRQREGMVRQRGRRPAGALHPRGRVERTELSLHRAGCAESVGADQDVWRAPGEEPRTRPRRRPSQSSTSRAIPAPVIPVSERAPGRLPALLRLRQDPAQRAG